MTDIVLNGQRNVIQSFSWCCVSTVPSVSLVISEIQDVLNEYLNILNILNVSS